MIETERLLLRPLTEEDLELVCAIDTSEKLLRYTPYEIRDRKEAEAHLHEMIDDWKKTPRLHYEMAVILKETGKAIGRTHVLLDLEIETGMIGWILLEEYWGNHYATEITKALQEFCFVKLGMHRVNALTNPGNGAARRVLTSCGFRLEAHLKQKCRYQKHGQVSWEDELQYAILDEEYGAC